MYFWFLKDPIASQFEFKVYSAHEVGLNDSSLVSFTYHKAFYSLHVCIDFLTSTSSFTSWSCDN